MLRHQSGLHQNHISEIENRGKAGTMETLSKLAEALDVPAGWLGRNHSGQLGGMIA
ncbi:MAG: helix-turn-helix transcriptional regulator [Rhizobiales bacterium]|nr:helix-turn-helix transcriptional regulator [Hyphomicrobiales bacterium]MBI3672512.1 helix-turn-helix transcriptional regulator [Hyphomicrobiales bacterium]